MLYLILLLVVIALVVWMKRGGQDGTTDFEVLRVEFTPPPGSEVVAGSPITCEVHYRYSKPRKPMRAWVRLPNANSTYSASGLDLKPGTGSFTRQVEVSEADVVEVVDIVGRDDASRVKFEHQVPANFTIVPDPELERLQDDGAGARVTDVRFDPPSGSTVKVGSPVVVEIDFEVESERGLSVWAFGGTRELGASYAPSDDTANGIGTVRRWICIDKPGDVDEVNIVMDNVAGRTVHAEKIPATFHFR